jgi:hypothetical protein
MSGSRNPIPSFLSLENNQALSLPTRIATRVTRLVHPKIIFDFDAPLGRNTMSESAAKRASEAASETRWENPDLISPMQSFEKEWLQSDGRFNLNVQRPCFLTWVQPPPTSATIHDATSQKRALGFYLSNPWFPVDAGMVE